MPRPAITARLMVSLLEISIVMRGSRCRSARKATITARVSEPCSRATKACPSSTLAGAAPTLSNGCPGLQPGLRCPWPALAMERRALWRTAGHRRRPGAPAARPAQPPRGTPHPPPPTPNQPGARDSLVHALHRTKNRPYGDPVQAQGIVLGDGCAGWFGARVCGEDVSRKKPGPEVYLRGPAQRASLRATPWPSRTHRAASRRPAPPACRCW